MNLGRIVEWLFMNVLVIDFTGDSVSWLSEFGKENLNVIQTITREEQQWCKILDSSVYEAILIFESCERELLYAMVEKANISDERIIFALDIESWITHKWAAYALLNKNNHIYRMVDFFPDTFDRKYQTCTVDDISYIGYRADSSIEYTA